MFRNYRSTGRGSGITGVPEDVQELQAYRKGFRNYRPIGRGSGTTGLPEGVQELHAYRKMFRNYRPLTDDVRAT
jgi:hypothetical protein